MNNTTVPLPWNIKWDKDLRINVLSVEVGVGVVGCLMVCLWMYHNRRRKSRLNTIILNLTVADFLVLLLSALGQIIWETLDYVWYAGNAGCKIFKLFQTFAMTASTFMLIVIAVDRHQAIRYPLRKPFPVWKMAGLAWSIAWLLSTPQAYIFSQRMELNNETNLSRCKSHFDIVGITPRRAYLTFVTIVNFFLPLIAVTVCYVRIFLKISAKERENRDSKNVKPGKIHLQSTSSSLPKAKAKTLKMTIVIVLNFILCSVPYNSAEMILSYRTDFNKLLSPLVWGLFAALTIANSVTNPYIFLYFNTNETIRRAMCKCCPCVHEPSQRRQQLDSSVTATTNLGSNVYTRTTCRYQAPDVVDLPIRGKNAKSDVYLRMQTEDD